MVITVKISTEDYPDLHEFTWDVSEEHFKKFNKDEPKIRWVANAAASEFHGAMEKLLDLLAPRYTILSNDECEYIKELLNRKPTAAEELKELMKEVTA